MANKIGRFEILSEIVRSEFSAVYKAADPESGQTIALKTIQLQMLGDQASVLVDQILQEAEGTKSLNSHNIALLYGLEANRFAVLRRHGVRTGQQHWHHAGA